MFIELSEFLRCPQPHEDSFCVVVPHEMKGRMIQRGLVGCPVCQREYPIQRGLVRFGGAGEVAEARPTGASVAADPEVVLALLGLNSPGGFVVLVGSASRLAAALAQRLEGVHFVGINPPADVESSPALTRLAHSDTIPLRQSVARGVVLGAEACVEPWISEGARVLLHGLRLAAVAETLSAPGLDELAVGRGLWVGQKAAATPGMPRRSGPGTSSPPRPA